MLKNIKAVIFDLDGTLIDSMGIWKSIDIAYFREKNIKMPADLQQQIEGLSMRETATYFKEQFGIEDDEVSMMDTWNQMAMDYYAMKVSYKEGAQSFLAYLKDHHVKTGIATSNSRELLMAVSEHLGLHQYIDCFLTGNEVAYGKPSPDVYLEVAKRLQVEPNDCLVFEDVIPGIMAGKNAGMKVCAVYDDYSKDIVAEKKQLADFYIESYNQLLNR